MEDLIFKRMTNVVNRYVKHWKTDFTEYDIGEYDKSMNGTEFIWIVRPCGTHLLHTPNQLQMIYGPLTDDEMTREVSHIHDVVSYYNESKNRFYHIIKGQSIKKVPKQFCLDLINKQQLNVARSV
jgi:hypothetical protein